MSHRIGFVDFDLENFHADVYLKLIREDLADRGFEVAGATGLKAEQSRAWAEKNGVVYYDSASDLNEHVDHYAVLAPSNPEVHEQLCQQVFPFKKTTYVDKTFARFNNRRTHIRAGRRLRHRHADVVGTAL